MVTEGQVIRPTTARSGRYYPGSMSEQSLLIVPPVRCLGRPRRFDPASAHPLPGHQIRARHEPGQPTPLLDRRVRALAVELLVARDQIGSMGPQPLEEQIAHLAT